MSQSLFGLKRLPQCWNRTTQFLSLSPSHCPALSQSLLCSQNESFSLLTISSRRSSTKSVLSSRLMENDNDNRAQKRTVLRNNGQSVKTLVNTRNGVSSCPSSSCSSTPPIVAAESENSSKDNNDDTKIIKNVNLKGLKQRENAYNTESVLQKSNNNIVPEFSSMPKDCDDIGLEITGRSLKKNDIAAQLNRFTQRPTIRLLAAENGLKPKLFLDAVASFRRKILETDVLDPELHIILNDIIHGSGHVDDLFPIFLKFAKRMFPHIDCLDDLKKISDLRLPPNWYPEARKLNRKFVFHCGPTNSGKTWNAMNAFLESKSGLYCGPLKMLAVEVFQKANNAGVPCDLITGEEKTYASESGTPSMHASCTVEMSSTTVRYDVAIIDEIQMLRDPERGWAWTRALLGLVADEIHLCGEKAAVNLVMELLNTTGEHLEVREYNRLTTLQIQDEAVSDLRNVQPGDCIVCFSKRDIYEVRLKLERMGFDVATIYGTLPPAAKLQQSNRFNDPNDPCNIMVATDAIGMGLNLAIRRVIFHTLIKPRLNERNERVYDVIAPPHALQIAGRAGRYGSRFSEGYCTTMKKEDLPILKKTLTTFIDDIGAAGLHPTVEQIEMFSYLLPKATLSNILDIFIQLCQVNRHYFLCNIDNIKYIADILEHIPMTLRAKYTFCCAPVSNQSTFICAILLKYARRFSNGQSMNAEWLCSTLQFPWTKATNIAELDNLLSIYDCIDLYLWLSYRFPDMFLDQDLIRNIQRRLDRVICECVTDLTNLLSVSPSRRR